MYLKKSYLCIIILFLFGCSSKMDYDGMRISEEFYNLNKGTDFLYFKNKEILSIREYSTYDNNTQRNERIPIVVALHLEKDTILALPTYKKGADKVEREKFFNRCDSAILKYLYSKYSNIFATNSLFESYQIEVDSLYQEYSKVIVPKILPYNNIPIKGHGGYIEFTLFENKETGVKYTCYYIIDSLDLESKSRSRLKELDYFDNNWFYQIQNKAK